jgi:hypothetical protein
MYLSLLPSKFDQSKHMKTKKITICILVNMGWVMLIKFFFKVMFNELAF